MKKLLVGMIVLAALLSVPMAVSAVSDTGSTVISAGINSYINITTTDIAGTWTLTYQSATDNRLDISTAITNIKSNYNYTISASAPHLTAGGIAMVNPVNLSVLAESSPVPANAAVNSKSLTSSLQQYYAENGVGSSSTNTFTYDIYLFQIVDITDDAQASYSTTITWSVATLV